MRNTHKTTTQLTGAENRLVVVRGRTLAGEEDGKEKKKEHYLYKYHFCVKDSFWIF